MGHLKSYKALTKGERSKRLLWNSLTVAYFITLSTQLIISNYFEILQYYEPNRFAVWRWNDTFFNISLDGRLDAIAVDAELEDKPTEDLVRLADILHNGCLRAVAEYEEKLKEDPNFDGKLSCITFDCILLLMQPSTRNPYHCILEVKQ